MQSPFVKNDVDVRTEGKRVVMIRRLRPFARRAYLALRRSTSRLLIERRAGLETAGEVNLEDLGLDATDRVRYEPSGWIDLRRVLRRGDVRPDDVFVDFGAGKGRVLVQAATRSGE